MIDASRCFDGWRPIERTVPVGALAWLALVAMLRISGVAGHHRP